MSLPGGLAAILLGLALFLLDSFTVTDGAASVLYVAVLILAGRWQRRGVLAVAVLCIILTAATYWLPHGLTPVANSIFRRLVSIVAIIIATGVVLRGLTASNTLDGQARLLDLTDDAILVRNLADVILYWNRGAERLYGWSSRQAIGQPASTLLGTKFPVPIDEIKAVLGAGRHWEGELVNTTRSGAQVIVACRWAPQRDARGDCIAIVETGADVTRRREADREVRRSEERYRAIFRTAGVAIWEEDFSNVLLRIKEIKATGVLDMAGFCDANPRVVLACVRLVRLVDCNDSAVRMFEAESKEDLLESLERVYLPGTTGSFVKIMMALAEGAPSCEGETTVRTLRGRLLTVRMSITFPNEPHRMNGVLVSIMDVTERRRTEDRMMIAQESLAQVAKLSTLGEVTASIAHEVNQPLAAIVTNAEASLRWLRRATPDIAEAGDAIERVISDGQRATEVVARIRAFLGKTSPQRNFFTFADVVGEASRLIQRDIQAQGVSLHIALAPDLPPILGDRLQIEQVVLNLLVNGLQSMAGGGEGQRMLTVTISRHEGQSIIVQVGDNGSGIAADELRKLFRPFFTTKPDGMGLGLTICRSIVTAHGGRIWASSQVGHGTVVQFTLPIEPVALPVATLA